MKIRVQKTSSKSCCRKGTSTCISCQKPFCNQHFSKSTKFGSFSIRGEFKFYVPFERWQFMVCAFCSRFKKNDYESWEPIVYHYPYFLKEIRDLPTAQDAWKSFLEFKKLSNPHASYIHRLLQQQLASQYFAFTREELLSLPPIPPLFPAPKKEVVLST